MFGRKGKRLTPEELAENRIREIATEVFAEAILEPRTALAVIETVALDKNLFFRLKRLIETGSPRFYDETTWNPETREAP